MQERYLASADLGTSKIALTVAKVCGENVQIIYYGETPSDGVRYSCIFNPGKASEALKEAVGKAERELRIKIRQLVVGLPRFAVRQEIASGKIVRTNPDECIPKEEIEMLKNVAIEDYPLNNEEKEIIYGAVAQSFSTDGIFQGSEDDIVGATSESIEGNFKIFIGDSMSYTTLVKTLNLAEISLAETCFLPDALAHAVLTEEEKENGVALIELGAGVTSLCIYQSHIMRYYASIPFGGDSITTDIKFECGFKKSLAENIKLAFGVCMPEKLQSMGEKIIQITDEENGTYGQKLPVKYLSEIITSRQGEIIEAILFLIQESGYSEKLRSGIVITGGGANLANLSGLVKEMSGYRVRIGYPRKNRISAEGCNGISETGAAASVGMILEAKKNPKLNCTSEPAAEPQEEAVGISEEEKLDDTVFQGHEESIIEEQKKKESKMNKPRKPKTPKQSSKMNRLSGIIWSKISEGFDGAVGVLEDLYDDAK